MAELIERDARQAEIVAKLYLFGADNVAAQVTRCWADRLDGNPGRHRYRCRSCSCLTCRRPPLAGWWRSYRTWCEDEGRTSYFSLLCAEAFVELPLLSKQLRNLRDRLIHEESWLWADVAFLGVSDGKRLHILVSHPGISQAALFKRLKRLRPQLELIDAPEAPVARLETSMLARLGARGRGYQPLRFQVLPSRIG